MTPERARGSAAYVDAARLRAAYRSMGAAKPPPAPAAPGFEAPRNEITPGGNFTQMDLLDALPKSARVAKYGAMMSSDFLACETVKARAVRSLPVHVMRKGERGPEKAEGHPLDLVLRRPNALMAWGDLVAWAQLRRDVFGTAYMRVYRNARGDIREIRPVVSAVTASFDRATGVAVYSGREDYYNEKWACREDDLLVLRTDVSEDGGKTGRSIAEMCADDIGLSIDLTRFYRALVENGNHFQGYFETDQKLDLDDIRAIKDKLDVLKGPDGAGQSPIWDAGLKYHEVSIKLDGMQLVDQERFVLEKVCRACHVDMHHVYADSGAAATAAAGADLDFAKNTVLPEVTAWEQAFQVLLDRAASLAGKPSAYYVKFNMAGLERADTKTRMEAHRIAVYSGIYSRAHACELEEIAWMPGQDELLQPTAYYVLDEDGNPTVPDARTLGTSGQSDGVSGIDRKAVEDGIRILADDAADRIARRAAADGDTAKTRDFARAVMQPVVLAARRCGMEIDPEAEIQDAIDRGHIMPGSNQKPREWYRVTRNEADVLDIDIYGDIGESRDWWTGEKEGIGAKSFLDTLREAKGKAVNLHINSGGGSVIDAYAMMTAISNHDGKVTAYIDGLAASAASFLAAAADEVVMSSVAWMMIHNASIFCWGDAEEMRAQAEYLEKVDAQITGIYAKRSATKDESDFAEAMRETTWFTADDALEWGLVDRIEEAVAAAACATEDRATRQSAPDEVLQMLQGETCVFRRIGDMLSYGENSTSLALFTSPATCDTSANIPNDEGEPAAQEPAAAQERAVLINGKLCKVKERGENA